MQILDEVHKDLLPNEVPVEFNLLRSQVAIQVEDGPLTLASAEVALAQLESGEGSYDSADRQYLIEYAHALIHYCEAWRYQQDSPSTVNMTLVRLSKVSKHLRQKYPLPADGSFL